MATESILHHAPNGEAEEAAVAVSSWLLANSQQLQMYDGRPPGTDRFSPGLNRRLRDPKMGWHRLRKEKVNARKPKTLRERRSGDAAAAKAAKACKERRRGRRERSGTPDKGQISLLD